MKKLLFGLLAVSSVLYGVGNPGDKVPSSGGTGSAAVPMEVRVTVLPKGPQLVLVDENNVLIKKLTFDHGNLVAGLNTGSTIEKEVRLMRADGKAFGAPEGNGNTVNNNYLAKFEAKDLNAKAISGENGVFALNGHGEASVSKINSNLNYRAGDIPVTGVETMVATKVVSTVPELGSDQLSGLYVGSGTFTATLTFVSAPAL